MMNKTLIYFQGIFPAFPLGGRKLPAVLVFLLAAIILGFEPVRWLVNTWLEPAYDSKGFYIFLACAALFAWSASSPRHVAENRPAKKAGPGFVCPDGAGAIGGAGAGGQYNRRAGAGH